MALILNIETSTTNCSVSLSKKGETLFLKEDYSTNYSHAERLHLFIDELIKSSNFALNHLDAVAISKGPGSYTGLRIGVSAAKGLCFALDIPLISVSTLEALAHQVNIKNGIIIPMLDARRQEVYSAVFNSSYELIREIKAEIIKPNSFNDYTSQNKVYCIGNGVEKTKAIASDNTINFIEGKLPSAKTMSKLAYKKYKIGDIENVAYFEPFYLKDFIALKPKV